MNNRQNIKLTITGIQKDIDTEPVVQNMQGLLTRRGDSIYIQYTEEEGLPCMMKITSSRVEIKRGGANGSLLFFEKDAVCRTYYDTPSGKLEAEFRTGKIEVRQNPVKTAADIQVSAEYLLLINGEKVSDCGLDILVVG